jgi:predicted PurR-regulated permease PerM
MSKKIAKWLAILSSLLLLLLVFGIIIYFFISQILSFREDLPLLSLQLKSKIIELQKYIAQHTPITRKEQSIWLNQKIEEIGTNASTYVMSFFSSTGSFISNLLLIPVYIYFITFYSSRFKNFILFITDAKYHEQIFIIIKKVTKVSQQYLKGILIDILILAVLNSIGFLLLGIKHAILLGTLAAILNIIPYIGVLVGSIFPFCIALLTKDSIWYAVGVIMVCTVVQFIDNNFITPKVVGASVSLNPLAATLALIAGSAIWGVMGMVLFIPLMGMIKVFLDNINSLHPFGYLIGDE